MDWNRQQKRRRRNPNTLTVKKVAEITGFHHNTVLYWIRKRQLKATYDGYQYQVNPRELRRFLDYYYVDDAEGSGSIMG
ncbi:helix-turn-helix domain-containing protein [Chloroflexota bacterium]